MWFASYGAPASEMGALPSEYDRSMQGSTNAKLQRASLIEQKPDRIHLAKFFVCFLVHPEIDIAFGRHEMARMPEVFDTSHCNKYLAHKSSQ